MLNLAVAFLLSLVAAINASVILRTSASSDVIARQNGPFPVRIHPALASNPPKCLDVRGGLFANGTAVGIFDCNGTPAQDWLIQPNNTQVRLSNTNFCLDAGTTPANGVGMKIWQCIANLPAQSWFLTTDNRIALFNQALCLDLPNGNVANGVQVQTWQCTDNDANQVWLTSS